MQKLYKPINLMVIAISFFLFGLFLGRKTKICPKLEVLKTDTFYIERDISGGIGSPIEIHDTTLVETKPKNTVIEIPKLKFLDRVKHDTSIIVETEFITDTLPCKCCTSYFISQDSINYVSPYGDKLGVAIKDSGNCYGVFDRRTKWYGMVKERVITNTIVKKQRQKWIKVGLGVSATAPIGQYIPSAYGLAAGLDIGRKIDIGYNISSNGLNSVNLLYKIR